MIKKKEERKYACVQKFVGEKKVYKRRRGASISGETLIIFKKIIFRSTRDTREIERVRERFPVKKEEKSSPPAVVPPVLDNHLSSPPPSFHHHSLKLFTPQLTKQEGQIFDQRKKSKPWSKSFGGNFETRREGLKRW